MAEARTLRVSPDLELPLDAVTRRLAILAMSGAGKSNAAVVLAEAMFDAGVPWVAIDPKGDWWGVRSSATGKGDGLAVPIFGGLHADVPLDPDDGARVAELVIDQRLTCVIDVSEFGRQALWGFLIAFGETLLRRNRQPLHVFLEEADDYLPQKATEKGNLPRCLGVWQRVVKQGRFRGIGSTQITQRNALLNKNTLYMADLIVAMRATGKADRDAVRGWVDHNDGAAEIVSSLPTLQDGEAWISSPGWLRLTKRIRFGRRRTFDSGATPVMLDATAPPARLAPVDLDALRATFADAVERAKADDPAALRARIAELEAQLDAPPAPVVERVDVPAVAPELVAELTQLVAVLDGQVLQARLLADQVGGALVTAHGALAAARDVGAPPAPVTVEQVARAFAVPPRLIADRPASGGSLPAGEAKVLRAIAQHGAAGVSREQLSVLTGYKKSSRDQYVVRLRGRGLVVDGAAGALEATAAGRAALGPDFQPLPTGSALRRYWLDRLPEGERVVLELVCRSAGRPVSREAISAATTYRKSSRDQYIGRLARRKLIEVVGPGEVRASRALFDVR